MNYYRFVMRRRLDISHIRAKLQKLFSFLQNGDYERLQRLLIEAENILKKYEVGEDEK